MKVDHRILLANTRCVQASFVPLFPNSHADCFHLTFPARGFCRKNTSSFSQCHSPSSHRMLLQTDCDTFEFSTQQEWWPTPASKIPFGATLSFICGTSAPFGGPSWQSWVILKMYAFYAKQTFLMHSWDGCSSPQVGSDYVRTFLTRDIGLVFQSSWACCALGPGHIRAAALTASLWCQRRAIRLIGHGNTDETFQKEENTGLGKLNQYH